MRVGRRRVRLGVVLLATLLTASGGVVAGAGGASASAARVMAGAGGAGPSASGARASVTGGAAITGAPRSARPSLRQPAAQGATKGELVGISCPSPSLCMMVGANGAKPVAEYVKPTGWTVLSPVVKAGETTFDSVSCPSPLWCMAVGSITANSGAELPLAESWNGKSWKVVASITPRRTDLDVLNGVSCTSPANCVAVGTSNNKLLVEDWDGTGWAVRAAPQPGGATQSALTAVDCPSARFCVAVGSYANTTTGLPFLPLVASYNGHSWSAAGAVDQKGASGGILESASCISVKGCMVGGSSENSAGVPTPLADWWNGTKWSVTTQPGLSGGDSYFESVSCTSAQWCMGVGNSHNLATLVASWDGKSWTVRPYPHPGSTSVLNGVACVSANHCTAAGHYVLGSSGDLVLTASWNGSGWAIPAT